MDDSLEVRSRSASMTFSPVSSDIAAVRGYLVEMEVFAGCFGGPVRKKRGYLLFCRRCDDICLGGEVPDNVTSEAFWSSFPSRVFKGVRLTASLNDATSQIAGKCDNSCDVEAHSFGDDEPDGPLSVQVVTNGVVFIGGRYLAPAYTIVAFDSSVSINGISVISYGTQKHVALPRAEAYISLPAVPTTMTDKHTGNDALVNEYLQKCMWHYVFYDVSNRAEMVASAMEKLPCVAKATVVSDCNIRVLWKGDGGSSSGNDYYVYPEFDFYRTHRYNPIARTCLSLAERYAYCLKDGGAVVCDKVAHRNLPFDGKFCKEVFPLLISLLDEESSAESISRKITERTGRILDVSLCEAILNQKGQLSYKDRDRLIKLK